MYNYIKIAIPTPRETTLSLKCLWEVVFAFNLTDFTYFQYLLFHYFIKFISYICNIVILLYCAFQLEIPQNSEMIF
jgi:hypothetical protein